MAHHQKANRLHAQFARIFDMLARDVGLGAVGGDAHDARAGIVGGAQVVDGADAGQQQGGNLCALYFLGNGANPLDVGMRAKAVIEAAALQAVAMRHFDRIDAGGVEGARDCPHLPQAVLVAHCVAAIAQRHVGDVDFFLGHAVAS